MTSKSNCARTWIAAASLLALLGAVAGCGKKQNAETAQQNPPSEQPAETTPAPPDTTARDAGMTQPPAETATAPSTTGSEKVVTTSSGLKYVDLVEGTGPSPQTGQVAVVHYTGWLKDGTKFDSSRDRGQPFEFAIGRGMVIKGWDEGVSTMKVGGKRRLIVPPGLGYGAQGAGGVIPPNAELTFEVELLGVR